MILPPTAVAYRLTPESKCTSKRLDLPPGVAARIPIKDQDGTRLCTAFSASQLIDSWRIINDPPVTQFTSPIALGAEHAAMKGRNDLNGFLSTEIIENARNLNSCSYNAVSDQFNQKQSADFLNELAASFATARGNNANLEVAANRAKSCLMAAGLYKSTISLASISQHLLAQNRIQFISRILNDVCAGQKIPLTKIPPIVIERSAVHGSHSAGMPKMRDLINRRLDESNPQPIGISYCRDVLLDPNVNGVSERGFLTEATCKGELHSSVIVGRRLLRYQSEGRTKTICQFLVRDSYGTSCNAYKDDPNATPKEVCERGQVWVDEDVLMHNTSEVYHLK